MIIIILLLSLLSFLLYLNNVRILTTLKKVRVSKSREFKRLKLEVSRLKKDVETYKNIARLN